MELDLVVALFQQIKRDNGGSASAPEPWVTNAHRRIEYTAL
ncbi:MAG: hypothetical protein AAGA03_03370 [Planctomycetota bacterium]